jgi:hypothetical protein
MSKYSSFKEHQLITENWRKFLSEERNWDDVSDEELDDMLKKDRRWRQIEKDDADAARKKRRGSGADKKRKDPTWNPLDDVKAGLAILAKKGIGALPQEAKVKYAFVQPTQREQEKDRDDTNRAIDGVFGRIFREREIAGLTPEEIASEIVGVLDGAGIWNVNNGNITIIDSLGRTFHSWPDWRARYAPDAKELGSDPRRDVDNILEKGAVEALEAAGFVRYDGLPVGLSPQNLAQITGAEEVEYPPRIREE